MPDADVATDRDKPEQTADPAVKKAIRSTEAYEIPDGVVFYDSENPLAWMQADEAIDLDSAA